jgi:hypothetical protein
MSESLDTPAEQVEPVQLVNMQDAPSDPDLRLKFERWQTQQDAIRAKRGQLNRIFGNR